MRYREGDDRWRMRDGNKSAVADGTAVANGIAVAE